MIVWLWKYLKVTDNMIAYFFKITDLSAIAETLKILWSKRLKYGQKGYRFLKEICEVLGEYPTFDKS